MSSHGLFYITGFNIHFMEGQGGFTFMMHLLVEILINLLISQLKLLLYGNGMANESASAFL